MELLEKPILAGMRDVVQNGNKSLLRKFELLLMDDNFVVNQDERAVIYMRYVSS